MQQGIVLTQTATAADPATMNKQQRSTFHSSNIYFRINAADTPQSDLILNSSKILPNQCSVLTIVEIMEKKICIQNVTLSS